MPSWTDNYCGRCHQIDSIFTHPVGVIPTMDVPSNLPLQDGRITCVTCHDNSAESHAQARDNHTSMLRDSNVVGNFCTQCHDPHETTRSSQHGAVLGRAHLAWPGNSDEQTTANAGEFDQETQTCLTCHDGSVSMEAPIAEGNSNTFAAEHPVGVSLMGQHLQSGTLFQLRSPGTIDHRIRLFDGRIGCTSCHSPFSTEPKLLVMPNRKSRLCLSCHRE
jgi:predicted CXXCH cytochrome family protein